MPTHQLHNSKTNRLPGDILGWAVAGRMRVKGRVRQAVGSGEVRWVGCVGGLGVAMKAPASGLLLRRPFHSGPGTASAAG